MPLDVDNSAAGQVRHVAGWAPPSVSITMQFSQVCDSKPGWKRWMRRKWNGILREYCHSVIHAVRDWATEMGHYGEIKDHQTCAPS